MCISKNIIKKRFDSYQIHVQKKDQETDYFFIYFHKEKERKKVSFEINDLGKYWNLSGWMWNLEMIRLFDVGL